MIVVERNLPTYSIHTLTNALSITCRLKIYIKLSKEIKATYTCTRKLHSKPFSQFSNKALYHLPALTGKVGLFSNIFLTANKSWNVGNLKFYKITGVKQVTIDMEQTGWYIYPIEWRHRDLSITETCVIIYWILLTRPESR